MEDLTTAGDSIWDLMIKHLRAGSVVERERDPATLTDLLYVMVLRGAPPAALVALLSPANVRVVQKGARLRLRLPAYLVQRRALLDAHCPVIAPLRALVHGYMDLTTTEDVWATGLGAAPLNYATAVANVHNDITSDSLQ
jgi:hypothetical protein